ncbi:MAG: hypothetical protein JWO62_1188 [Acidimicrobiaceae bacterium]|nr:hypothetical protein [Acidimicrobiaceae bacterium]
MSRRQPGATTSLPIRRELTAISRKALSVPAGRALESGLLDRGTVLDYGCGRGEDVRQLSALGLDVDGWDPHFRPEPLPRPVDVVMLTYVLNAIESADERTRTLAHAWSLAQRILIVTVRTEGERHKVQGDSFADGLRTSRSTFQRLFDPASFRTWVEATLGLQCLPTRPGQVVAFRDRDDLVTHVASMFAPDDRPAQSSGQMSATDVINTNVRWLRVRGRPPIEQEDVVWHEAARTHFGSVSNAAAAARKLVDATEWIDAKKRTTGNVLVTLALDTFHGRTTTSSLPRSLVADSMLTHGSVREARAVSDRLLRFLARPDLLQRAIRASRIGKQTPSSLYVHVSCTARLSTPLRVYAACAELVTGRPDTTTLVKLNHDRPTVSFLTYPEFDSDPHPRLAQSMVVDLRHQTAIYTDYLARDNRPLLHRKHEFLAPDHADVEKYQRLTRQEVKAGLYAHPELIGLERGWQSVLHMSGYELRGHRLIRSKGP